MEKENKTETSTFQKVYNDTVFFVDGIVNDYPVFPAILDMMREGNASIELKKKYMLRAIDETWVRIIEDTLPALDAIIRSPSRYIEEIEEVLPIELSRNISPRSLKHLSQHTNLISKIDGDEIVPSKLLNVFREETIQTYENKFVNTLINRLYIFVNRRYEIALKSGQDEKTTSLDLSQEFTHGDVKGKMHFRVEIAENAENTEKVEKNYTHTTDLWHRVERLNKICASYANSDFVQKMGKSYIRPPVMRTNAILKNKNLRQCLELWQFIESYENAGYSMLVQEDLEKVDEKYIKELYSTLALQYLIFRYNIHNEFDADSTLASQTSADIMKPRIVSEFSEMNEREYDVKTERKLPIPSMTRYGTLTPEDKLMLTALDIALDASDIIKEGERRIRLLHGEIPEPAAVPETKDASTEETSAETKVPPIQTETEESTPVAEESVDDSADNSPESTESLFSETKETVSEEKPRSPKTEAKKIPTGKEKRRDYTPPKGRRPQYKR